MEQPTGGNGATRAPISIDLNRDSSLSSQSITLIIDKKTQEVSASKIAYNGILHVLFFWLGVYHVVQMRLPVFYITVDS